MGSNQKMQEYEEKIVLLSAQIKRLRSEGTEHEGTKQKLLEYENK